MKVKGSFTIEAVVIVPMILFVCGVLLHVMFYYHDKNILTAAAHETLAYANHRTEPDEADLQEYFEMRIKGRMLVFATVESCVQIENKNINVTCLAGEEPLILKLECVTKLTEPEDYIRNVRKLKKIEEGIEEEF